MDILPFSQIIQNLQKLKNWKLVDGKINKEFLFSNFPTAILFVNRLVDPAEELDHHPEIRVNYNRVNITLYSHEAGGITVKDFELAEKIEELCSNN